MPFTLTFSSNPAPDWGVGANVEELLEELLEDSGVVAEEVVVLAKGLKPPPEAPFELPAPEFGAGAPGPPGLPPARAGGANAKTAIAVTRKRFTSPPPPSERAFATPPQAICGDRHPHH